VTTDLQTAVVNMLANLHIPSLQKIFKIAVCFFADQFEKTADEFLNK